MAPPERRDPATDRISLASVIAEEEARLAALDREREDVRRRLEQLREEAALLDLSKTSPDGMLSIRQPAATMTAAEKVALFRSLFRGRDELYAKLWINPRNGKKGYAPACGNEWIRGVCEKPRVRCGECPNQAFLPLTERVLLDHLQGHHVIGVYPLLSDETCCFLAVDFDKHCWAEDVTAFAETCRRFGVPVAVERSRSGNGAHAWFFFASPVSASIARQMGCFLVTEATSQRHQLSMESYDRLFPNQDTMPRGGFGNLIALPLQHEARNDGNTVFLNDRLIPYADQWAYLAGLPRLPPATVEQLAAEAARKGQVLGVRAVDLRDDEDNQTPWMRSSSLKPCRVPISEPLPPTLVVVLAQRVFVPKTGLPSALLNQIKRLAAFQNPEFYKKQNLRLSTALTPRVIVCAEEFPAHVALPRGCLADLEDLLRAYGVTMVVEDERVTGDRLADIRFKGKLTPAQRNAAEALLVHDTGVLVAPPGAGKTVVGTFLIAQRACPTLVLVHRQPLLDQWIAQLSVFLGVENSAIGRIGGGKRTPNGLLDVAMLQSVVRGDAVDVASYGHVIVDECHHVPAVSFERVLSAVKARYLVGLTATPRRRDGLHPILEMQLGPARHSVDARSHAAKRMFEHHLFVRQTQFRFERDVTRVGIQDLYRALALDEQRNELIVNDVLNALEERRSPILLTERKDHLEYFADRLRPAARNLIIMQGGMGAKQRRELAGRMAAIPPDEERLLLATGRYIGEGFDDARLDTLFLALPVSWKGTLVQYAGRLHRACPGKKDVRIFDYVDGEVPLLVRMFERRRRGYRAIGYEREEPPTRYQGPGSEPVVDWDHGVQALDEPT